MIGDSHFMTIASLGSIQISVTPVTTNPGIMSVNIIAEKRKDALSMLTNKDETADQFATRIRSMIRSLLNGELRAEDTKEETPKPPTWEEQKAALKEKHK